MAAVARARWWLPCSERQVGNGCTGSWQAHRGGVAAPEPWPRAERLPGCLSADTGGILGAESAECVTLCILQGDFTYLSFVSTPTGFAP